MPVPPEKVYAFLVDPNRVITIIPDVQSSQVADENNFSVKAKVGLSFIRGVVSLKFSFKEKRPNSQAILAARGQGAGSSMDVELSFAIDRNAAGGSRVGWTTDAKLGGLLVSVGSRMVDSAAEKYITQVVDSLKLKLAT